MDEKKEDKALDDLVAQYQKEGRNLLREVMLERDSYKNQLQEILEGIRNNERLWKAVGEVFGDWD